MNMSGFHIQVKITSEESRYLHCHYQIKGKGNMEDGIMSVSYFLIRTRSGLSDSFSLGSTSASWLPSKGQM